MAGELLSELSGYDVCIISDGKPGHLNQSIGLVEALQRQNVNLTYQVVEPFTPLALFGFLIRSLWRRPITGSRLVIAAGHRTHLTLLVYGWVWRAKTVLLMKPSLPIGLFDLSIIPQHDQPPARSEVIETLGVLNRMQPGEKRVNHALVLLGGPSKHFEWDNDTVNSQLRVWLENNNDKMWTITTSRRTPKSWMSSFQSEIRSLPETLKVVSHEDTDSDWLKEELQRTAVCVVSEDSVSMIYEALSAGCGVGLIQLQPLGDSRVVAGVKKLKEMGQVKTLDASPTLSESSCRLKEADRCAQIIMEKGWL